MGWSLIPRETRFFDLFDEATTIINRAAAMLLELVTRFDRLRERAEEIKREERACDDVVRRIITTLDRTFITPLDREDIHTLTTSLDDVLDEIEAVAYRFVSFRIDAAPPETVPLARIVRDCCDHIHQAVGLLSNLRNAEAIQQHIEHITRLENEADAIYRGTESALFANPPDTLQLIKLRELYGRLEETVDACKVVSLILSEIVIKGS